MTRDARALSFEIDYWLALLDDVQEVNEIAVQLAGEVVRDDQDAALDKVLAIQDALKAMLRVIDGRVKAIRAEKDSA